MGEGAHPSLCDIFKSFYFFIFSTVLAGCCCSVLAKKTALSCTADTRVTQRALSIFSPRALSCLFVGDEELTVGGGSGPGCRRG